MLRRFQYRRAEYFAICLPSLQKDRELTRVFKKGIAGSLVAAAIAMLFSRPFTGRLRRVLRGDCPKAIPGGPGFDFIPAGIGFRAGKSYSLAKRKTIKNTRNDGYA
jgi:hypothetical protein